MAIFCVILCGFTPFAGATEVILKEECRCAAPTVKLGDIAEVYDVDVPKAIKLAATELFPTPTVSRSIDLAEVQRLLNARGVKTADCLFGGAARVEVIGAKENTAAPAVYRPGFDPTRVRLARQRVEQSILDYLRQRVDAGQRWTVKLDLTEREAEAVSRRYSQLTVEGGAEPWVGSQQFKVTVAADRQVQTLVLNADVTLPEMMVVARRPLRRGDTLQEGDVELAPPPQSARPQQPVYSLDEVVGQELIKSIPTGQPVESRDVQPPRLVRRNDIVTVYSLAAGVRVRMLGRAMEEGGLGDVITIQDLQTRQPLRSRARIAGFQTVEIYALGPRAVTPVEDTEITRSAERTVTTER
jgi:flagella basal body P-ring formation protein FlgA